MEKVFKTYDPPCEKMTSLVLTTSELNQKENEFNVKVVYIDDFYQEIKDFQEVSFETFFSSVGGFVGIFIGYSFLQIPDVLTGIPCYWREMKFPAIIGNSTL